MDQEILDFVEVSSDNAVQDTLAVSTIHDEEGLHLEKRGEIEGGEADGMRGGREEKGEGKRE